MSFCPRHEISKISSFNFVSNKQIRNENEMENNIVSLPYSKNNQMKIKSTTAEKLVEDGKKFQTTKKIVKASKIIINNFNLWFMELGRDIIFL